MPAQKGILLLLLLGTLLLAGCKTNPPQPDPEPVAPPPVPVQPSLEERWQQSAATPGLLQALLSRLQGRELRRSAREGAVTREPLKRILVRIDAAATHTRRAREIAARLYGYRKAGGVALETRWERELWKRLRSHRKNADQPAPDVSDLDLLAARRSLAAQVAKAWFHERGLRELRLRAIEVRDLYRQVLARQRTSRQLERGNQDLLLATRKELARADGRVKQLRKAENLARKALETLTGNRRVKAGAQSSVKPVPGGLSMRLLVNRPDLHRNVLDLLKSGFGDDEPAQLLPEVVITARGGRATRSLSRWSRYQPARLQEKLGLEAHVEAQQVALKAFATTLHGTLKELQALLNGGRGLVGQRSALQAAQQRARREVNRLRARYSARRADLTDILEAQIQLAEISGRLGYVQSRVFGQRLDSLLALGAAGF